MNTNFLLEAFLHLYFYQIEFILNNKDNRLEEIKFQSEEANTDEFLKKYFKPFMLEYNTISEINELGIEINEVSIRNEDSLKTISLKELKSFIIQNVYLPEELTEEFKSNIIATKQGVYTNPDLYLEISNGQDVFYKSVELKSTKTNAIPGSSVQQILPFEWVIFVKRTDKKVTVATGHYINSITNKLPFPDRSPRPQVAFDTMVEWNKKYRKKLNSTLNIEIDIEINKEKEKIFEDWQEVLVNEWINIIEAKTVKSNEKWFNNTLRKFVLAFLENIEPKSEDEIQNFKIRIQSLIK
ncbi:hypothetical protein E2605_08565 [Dysgonomonas capnocytophagoides]|uniref:Uncharacterized protein n=1 Tax=Dysgonomonas capnocytophagoides TaxID=45254 RepID=A0A4Y8L8P5_9BACT|nr:hypothetical protein [Dysgonomonas capnocytophagoides]TFD96856.1 hypothetical protein E2605_08565 [Dysgonomonas capnocytophagoides]